MQSKVMMEYVIKPAMAILGEIKPKANTPASCQFMLAVCAQESNLGLYFKQVGGGPARGPWQIEPATYDDLYANFIRHEDELLAAMPKIRGDNPNPLITNLIYSCVIARLCVYRYPEPMPEVDDVRGMYELYKRRFNSLDGAATTSQWLTNWDRYVKGVDL